MDCMVFGMCETDSLPSLQVLFEEKYFENQSLDKADAESLFECDQRVTFQKHQATHVWEQVVDLRFVSKDSQENKLFYNDLDSNIYNIEVIETV